MDLTDNKRDPADVLREWDEQWADNWQHNFIGNDLASALRDTLARADSGDLAIIRLKRDVTELTAERDQLRAKLDKAEAVVRAVVAWDFHEGPWTDVANAVAVYDAYDKESRDAPDD